MIGILLTYIVFRERWIYNIKTLRLINANELLPLMFYEHQYPCFLPGYWHRKARQELIDTRMANSINLNSL